MRSQYVTDSMKWSNILARAGSAITSMHAALRSMMPWAISKKSPSQRMSGILVPKTWP